MESDPKRQATDSLRGYAYQIWQTLHAWLELDYDQEIYVEGAEDFDILDVNKGIPVQVKDTCGRITLRNKWVTDAISHFWSLREAHPGKDIEFRFLTRSSIGVETGSPFGKERGGLSVWQDCQRGDASPDILSKFLRSDSKVKKRLPARLIAFLEGSSTKEVKEELIGRMTWLVEAPPLEAVVQAVERKLINHGGKNDIQPSLSVRVVDRLLREVLTAATEKEISKRRLDYSRFAIIFEDATTVRVPVQSPRARQHMQTWNAAAVVGGTGAQTFSFVSPPQFLMSIGLPPVPSFALLRDQLSVNATDTLRQKHFLCISGSTGRGKSMLAKLVARKVDGEWAWFSLSEWYGERLGLALSEVARQVDNLPRNVHVVLDDMDLGQRYSRQWESTFLGLLYTARARCIFTIITSQRNIPARIKTIAGLSSESEFPVPDITEEEAKELCRNLGCADEAQIEAFAKVATFHSGGHPQLLHAHLASFAQRGWPEVSASLLLQKPENVKEHQTQARQLLDFLPEDDRKVVYLATVSLSPFPRERIISVAESEGCGFPGDSFDRLVGPWIEARNDDRFVMSPLLRNAAGQAWSAKKVDQVHSELATAILGGKELSVTDGAHALFHAFIGKNIPALTGLGISFTTETRREVLEAIGNTAFWFLSMRVEDNESLLPDDPHVSLLLRGAQFRLCSAAEPEKAVAVLDSWEREVLQLESQSEALTAKMLCYTTGLVTTDVPLSMSRVLDLLAKLDRVLSEMKKADYADELKDAPVGSFGMEGQSLLTMLFSGSALRCQGKEDLDRLLDGLSEMDAGLRVELLKAFDMEQDCSMFFINGAYLAEGKKEAPNWQACIQILRKAMVKAGEWETPSLGAFAARAISIVFDEELGYTDKALEALDDGSASFPSEAWMLEEHRGNVLLRGDRIADAVICFKNALPAVENGCPKRYHSPLAAFRNAGLAASKLEEWEVAADFFHRGSLAAAMMEEAAGEAGFLTDAAHMFWKAGDRVTMFECLLKSVGVLNTLPRSKANLREYWVFRTTAQCIAWLKHLIEDGVAPEELEEPPAGVSSNFEPNELILELPEIPYVLMLLQLVLLERAIGKTTIALNAYGSVLEKAKEPVVAMLMSSLRMDDALKGGRDDNLPILLDKQVRSYVASKKLHEKDCQPWEIPSQDVSDQETKATLIGEEFLCGALLTGLLHGCCEGGMSVCTTKINTWRKTGSNVSWNYELACCLDTAEKFAESPVPDLRDALRDGSKGIFAQLVAGLFLACNASQCDLRDLFQAHVFLLDYFARFNPFWGRMAEKKVSQIVASGWHQKSKAQFAMHMPQVNAPELETRCSSQPESFGKAASVLLVAANAAGVSLPKAISDRYANLAEACRLLE